MKSAFDRSNARTDVSVHSAANIRTKVEEMGFSPETLFRVCKIENDPSFEDPRQRGFLSQAIYH
eukprot:8427264-Prorocentrum_lima.AAC.1